MTTPAYTATANASDTMNRTVAHGFGTAPMGGSYATVPVTSFSVTPGSGNIVMRPGTSAVATLSATTTADERVRSGFVLPRLPTRGIGVYYQLELRRTAAGDAYHIVLKVSPGGAMTVSCAIWRNGRQTAVGAPVVLPGRAVAGRTFGLEGMTAGSSTVLLRARVWDASRPTPDWQAGTSDSSAARLSAAGKIGVYAYTSANTESMALKVASLSGWGLTAPGTPPPPPPPPPPGGRGSVAVGAASYSIPAKAVFVSPSGNDAAAGTQAAPLRTVAGAVAKVASGTTIVMRAGTYHESVTVPVSKTGLTFQAYPKEAVWFDGSSAVTTWVPSGSTWVHTGWLAQFDHSSSFSTGVNQSAFIDPAYPMAAWPDQVFMDGKQLAQVGSAAQVTAGKFFVDYSAHTLRIGTNPAGHAVRASDLAKAFNVQGSGVRVQGFGVMRYATSLPDLGTVRLAGGYDTAQNLVITENATQGLSFRLTHNVADHVSAVTNGMVGIHGNTADTLLIENSNMSGNNTQHFNPSPSSGGTKVTRSRGVTIKNNLVSNNVNTKGIWLDESVVGFSISGNTVSGNLINIQAEISDTGTIANNVVSGGQKGIYLFSTGNVKIFNNAVSDVTGGSIFLSQDDRRESNPATQGHDPRQPIPDASCAWLLRNITVANNVFGNYYAGSGSQFYVLDKETRIPADQMHLTVNGNVFLTRASSTQPHMVVWGGNNNVAVSYYETPATFEAAKGSSWNNAQITNASMAVSVNPAYAVPLPSDVAAAIGVATGTRHLGTF